MTVTTSAYSRVPETPGDLLDLLSNKHDEFKLCFHKPIQKRGPAGTSSSIEWHQNVVLKRVRDRGWRPIAGSTSSFILGLSVLKPVFVFLRMMQAFFSFVFWAYY